MYIPTHPITPERAHIRARQQRRHTQFVRLWDLTITLRDAKKQYGLTREAILTALQECDVWYPVDGLVCRYYIQHIEAHLDMMRMRQRRNAEGNRRQVAGQRKPGPRAFTVEQIVDIRQQFAAGYTVNELAVRHGVSTGTMRKIRDGMSYYHPKYGDEGLLPIRAPRRS